jgi:hypothetical protein
MLTRRRLLTLALAALGPALSARPASATPSPPVSPPLRNPRLRSPLPSGVLAGYAGDTGLDLGGTALTVYALAAGTLDYSERGHTRWTNGRDTPNSVRLALDEPLAVGGGDRRRVTHVYYTHMASLAYQQAEGAPTRRRVAAGEPLGVSGVGNGVPHLHLGLLCDGQVEQDTWASLLREHEIRRLLGGYANGERLPRADS